jgi:hypothetical protein
MGFKQALPELKVTLPVCHAGIMSLLMDFNMSNEIDYTNNPLHGLG